LIEVLVVAQVVFSSDCYISTKWPALPADGIWKLATERGAANARSTK
jgi:hypothetical protein